MHLVLPSFHDDRHFSGVRAQAAVVRALLDELERQAGPHPSSVQQLGEEIGRLGSKMIEAANAMSRSEKAKGPDESGVHPTSVTRLRARL
jgi:hypothetical protein